MFHQQNRCGFAQIRNLWLLQNTQFCSIFIDSIQQHWHLIGKIDYMVRMFHHCNISLLPQVRMNVQHCYRTHCGDSTLCFHQMFWIRSCILFLGTHSSSRSRTHVTTWILGLNHGWNRTFINAPGACQSLGTWLHDRSHPLRHWVINKSVMYKPSRPEKLLAFWLPKSPRSSMKPMFGLSVSSRRSISDNKCLLAGHWTGPHLLDNHTTHDDWIYDCNVHQNACFIICIQFRLSPNLLSTSRSHLFDVGWLYASSQFWCIFFPPLQQSCQRFVKTFTAKEQKTSSCPLSLLKITWSSWLALFLLTLPQLWFEVLLNLVPPCIFVEHH